MFVNVLDNVKNVDTSVLTVENMEKLSALPPNGILFIVCLTV